MLQYKNQTNYLPAFNKIEVKQNRYYTAKYDPFITEY